LRTTDDLVEQVAAAFHTLLRSWHYDLEAGARGSGPVVLEPWLEPCAAGTVDLANTWWEDLPSEWRERFLALASPAAEAVVEAVESGASVAELDDDDAFVARVAEGLRRPWLAPPRVIVAGSVRREPGLAERVLARTAVHVYAGRAAGMTSLGTVPPFPPPDFSEMTRAGGQAGDTKTASFRVMGERLDPAALTQLTGLQPELAVRRGDLRISRTTGETYSPYRHGLWRISTGPWESDPALEDLIVRLLDQLDPSAAALRGFIDDHDLRADFFCGYAQRQFNSSWALSAGTLRRIAALGASLGYDAYVETD
jgi:Domain of unknown function (DUF4279)